jgi:hypothetical protein
VPEKGDRVQVFESPEKSCAIYRNFDGSLAVNFSTATTYMSIDMTPSQMAVLGAALTQAAEEPLREQAAASS